MKNTLPNDTHFLFGGTFSGWINKSSIIVFASLFILSLFFGLLAIKQNLKSERNFNQLEGEIIEATIMLSNAERALWELRFALPNYAAEGPTSREKIKQDFPNHLRVLQQNITGFEKYINAPEEKRLYAVFQKAFSEYIDLRSYFFDLIDMGKIEQARIYRLQNPKPAAQRSVAALERLIKYQHLDAKVMVSLLSRELKNTRILLVLYLILECLFCFVLLKMLSISARKMQLSRQTTLQSSKMASLGEMAGGVAHEINNPVGIIHGKASQLLRLVQTEKLTQEIAAEQLEKIIAMSNRIAKIVKGLRSFSRNADNDPIVPVELKTLFENVLSLCAERFKAHDITLEISVPELLLDCRAVQLEQVILNLLNNAHDAVVQLSEKWVHIEFKILGKLLEISVTDSGLGIPPHVVEKLMQPFFTTKEVGKGTGLGLSISKGIVEDHRGRLFYDSSCSNTRFVVELPVKQPI